MLDAALSQVPVRCPPRTPRVSGADVGARRRHLCSASGRLAELRPEIQFYEEVQVYMVAKLDADARRAEGKPVPEEISRLLAALLTASTETGEVIDIYEAAGMPKPELS